MSTPTLYEIACELPDGSRRVIGHSARKTKAALLDYSRLWQNLILAHIPDPDAMTPTYDKHTGWDFGGGVKVYFNGATLRFPSA